MADVALRYGGLGAVWSWREASCVGEQTALLWLGHA